MLFYTYNRPVPCFPGDKAGPVLVEIDAAETRRIIMKTAPKSEYTRSGS